MKHTLFFQHKEEKQKNEKKQVQFNPYKIIYNKDFIKDFEIDYDDFIKREIHIMGFREEDINVGKVLELLLEMSEKTLFLKMFLVAILK